MVHGFVEGEQVHVGAVCHGAHYLSIFDAISQESILLFCVDKVFIIARVEIANGLRFGINQWVSFKFGNLSVWNHLAHHVESGVAPLCLVSVD